MGQYRIRIPSSYTEARNEVRGGHEFMLYPENPRFTKPFRYLRFKMCIRDRMYAEAYNEYNGPGQPAYDALNKVRRRAGLRDVEAVWSDAEEMCIRDRGTPSRRACLQAPGLIT